MNQGDLFFSARYQRYASLMSASSGMQPMVERNLNANLNWSWHVHARKRPALSLFQPTPNSSLLKLKQYLRFPVLRLSTAPVGPTTFHCPTVGSNLKSGGSSSVSYMLRYASRGFPQVLIWSSAEHPDILFSFSSPLLHDWPCCRVEYK